MSDLSMIGVALLVLLGMAAGWVARSVGAPGGLRGDDDRPLQALPLHLKQRDAARAEKRWSRLPTAKWLRKWGPS